MCLQGVGAGIYIRHGVPIEEWANEFMCAAWLRAKGPES